MKLILFVAFTCFLCSAHAWFHGRPEPGDMTHGEVWPLPQEVMWRGYIHTLNPATFQFQVDSSSNSDILTAAIAKYKRWTFPTYREGNITQVNSTLTSLLIRVANNPGKIDYPQFNMNESYTLIIGISDSQAVLQASEVWGALRGLETFSQLVYQPDPEKLSYQLQAVTISDYPRFAHRGALIDTSRHFLSVNMLKRILDLMAQNKMNVLHWHIVDSESFPYTSTAFPNLSLKGAYTPAHIYSVADIKGIIDYARLRGIRVVAEFDTPGHMGAWEKGFPGLLAECTDSLGKPLVPSNIFDPSKPENYVFLENFFKEALSVFPDNYMHFGGDEVVTDMLQCWWRNKRIRTWMQQNGYGNDTYAVLQTYFQKLFAMVQRARNGTNMIVWQEVFDDKIYAPQAIAHVWKGSNYKEMMASMAEVTAAGHYAILSSCWYLNFIKYGPDWGYLDNLNLRLRGLYYDCDPAGFNGTPEQKKLVLGGEVTMWSEFVDGTNIIPRLWPRASAAAERLWSSGAMKDPDIAWPRLHEHRCRMIARGYPAQPINYPDYCPNYWDPDPIVH